jgi:hypothetical protein
MIYKDPNQEPEKPLSQKEIIQKLLDYSNVINQKSRQGSANYIPITISFLENLDDKYFMEFLNSNNFQVICNFDTSDYINDRIRNIENIINLEDINNKIKNINNQ